MARRATTALVIGAMTGSRWLAVNLGIGAVWVFQRIGIGIGLFSLRWPTIAGAAVVAMVAMGVVLMIRMWFP
ncbi:MAG: hypothetical protein ACE5JU_21450 [Candidatus Binatia bacterium]